VTDEVESGLEKDPEYDGFIGDDSDDESMNSRDAKVEDRTTTSKFHSSNSQPAVIDKLKQKNLMASFGKLIEKEGIIKPKPIIGKPQRADIKIEMVQMDKVSAQFGEEQSETKDSDDYVYIDSIYPGGGKIRVTKKHLNRILKRREHKEKTLSDCFTYPLCRSRQEGPMHGSRSRFAKKRPRDQNGRFYTKAELEEMRQQHYKDAVLAYLRCTVVPHMKFE
jgi:hypothetical protein